MSGEYDSSKNAKLSTSINVLVLVIFMRVFLGGS